jgi:hypothetical protein
MTKSPDVYYAVIAERLHKSRPRPRLYARIFTGKTQRAALSRARDSLLNDTEFGSRPEWEQEHGEVRDDAHWLEIMEDNGFIISAAKVEEED